MQTISIDKKLYTVEEYLQMEAVATYKHEYHDGEIIPMAGGTIQHGEIGGNAYVALKKALKRTPCKTFNSDVAVAINDFSYVYPDASVVCGEFKMGILNQNAIANPTLIVEVLSETTSDYDKGGKFDRYRSIASFAEYILIEQSKIEVSVYSKLENNHWNLQIFDNINDIIALKSVDCEIQLKDIYEDVIVE
jgi:Uma2 family endonuclease